MRRRALIADAWTALALTPAHACGAGRGRVPRTASRCGPWASGPEERTSRAGAAGAVVTVSEGETAPNFEGAHFPQKQN